MVVLISVQQAVHAGEAGPDLLLVTFRRWLRLRLQRGINCRSVAYRICPSQ